VLPALTPTVRILVGVADSHKDTMIRNDYDVMMAFFTLSTKTSPPPANPTPPSRMYKLSTALNS
jgi:hypothetical protein